MAELPRTSLSANHYDALGVARNASEQEIREAEMAMRKLYDQRAHLGDAAATDALRRLNEASAVLLNPWRRAEHDRSPETLWESFADVAHSPPLAKGERLGALREWLSGEDDPVRAATFLDELPAHALLMQQDLLGDG
ncbi:J domain-containing protein [Sorangium sp. So ce861]|uniref:J domain-containing protein n=1 Tax=Sorangium sp. So ce861 TaxID=3133323 RepID=UPI003F61ED3F